jgi:2-oxoglutarate dehydrogenase E2 component (dihydrolipoamide succinyltransferase)
VNEIKVPELGESITEGTIVTWLKKVGDPVEIGETLVEIETDKVNVEITSDFSGVLLEISKGEGDNVEVEDVIGKVGDSAAVSTPEPTSSPTPDKNENVEEKQEQMTNQVAVEQDSKNDTIASPASRRLARKLGVDINKVQTNDPLGRVNQNDIKAHAAGVQNVGNKEVAVQKQTQAQASKSTPEFSKPVEIVKMSRRRQTIAKRLVEAQHNAAMLTTFNEVDMTAIMDVRKRRKDKFQEKHDVKLGFMSFFTKAVVAALKQFPLLNAEIHGDELVLKKFYDIGIAVSAEEGLVVPVVRDADKLSFAEIEQSILDLSLKARSNKLAINDLQGGTFTITNGGVFGSLLSTPILNAPQVGILGMHKIQKRPMTMPDDSIQNRPMMYIALSYDHRIVDGREAVSFLATVKDLLEDPESLLLEG